MKNFIISILVIFIGMPNDMCAQSYAPNSGSSIIFYPVSDTYKKALSGYDCFYSTEDAYKNYKTKIKPANRFKQRNGITPFEEIEGHTFTVITSTVENQNANKLEKKTFLYFLRREDGERLFLRIPYVHREEDNVLTQSMSLAIKGTWGSTNYYISIPCCLSEDYTYIKGKYTGKNLMYYNSSNRKYDEEKKCKELLISNTEELQSADCQKLYSRNAIIYYCENIGFYNISNRVFKQPLALLKSNEKKFFVPSFDFRSTGSRLYGTHYSLKEFFEERNVLFEKEYANLDDDVKSLVGKNLVYDASWHEIDQYMKRRTCSIADGKEYQLKIDERLFFEKIDFSEIASDTYGLSLQAIMKDDSNTKIQIPARELKIDKYGYYGGIFSLEDTVLVRKHKKDIERLQKDSIDRIYYNNIKKKYGNNYATYYKGLYDFQKEKFRIAVAKWGPSVAKDICEGYVRIGWNKEKCRMSWGEPKDINRSVGSWGTHEQWCYYSSYLYFDNGKLSSIQN